MLESRVFDLWANEYEQEVDTVDNSNEYPFAGYKRVLSIIYSAIMERTPVKILDIGIGTGRLSSKLYEAGNYITGLDFSSEMLDKARAKMSNAKLYYCNIVEGFPTEIIDEKYDCIISTYALHHLTDDLKVRFIRNLSAYLNEGGTIFIGDIGFPTRIDLEKCRASRKPDEWDDDEYYFVFEELCEQLTDSYYVAYNQISHCAGLIELN